MIRDSHRRHDARLILLMLVTLVVLLAIDNSVNAQEFRIVSPIGLDSMEGDGRVAIGPDLVNIPFREQGLHLASDFGSLPPGRHAIVGYSIRLDSSSTAPITMNLPITEVRLSTTTTNSLSTTFAENIGTDETLVFTGDLMLDQPLGGPPREFGETLVFDPPFEYDPSKGNLLVDLTFNGGISPSLFLDTQSTPDATTIVLSLGDANAPAANFAGEFIAVREFTFMPVPEPSLLDFNNDSNVDVLDIDLLVGEIVAGANAPAFDLTADGAVNSADLDQWLVDAATINGFSEAYLHGDSNLDGSVDATDLNKLALNWRKNEDVAAWSAGDFKADGVVDSGDLNELALNWREAISTASTVNSPVPEPTSLFLVVLAVTTCGLRRRTVSSREVTR